MDVSSESKPPEPPVAMGVRDGSPIAIPVTIPKKGNEQLEPGFPTLLVTYDVGNDLFFSGHTALAVLGAIHAAHSGPLWLAIAAGIIAFGEALVVLVLRAHYTLDVVAGAFAAFVAYDIAMAISPSLDAWLR